MKRSQGYYREMREKYARRKLRKLALYNQDNDIAKSKIDRTPLRKLLPAWANSDEYWYGNKYSRGYLRKEEDAMKEAVMEYDPIFDTGVGCDDWWNDDDFVA